MRRLLSKVVVGIAICASQAHAQQWTASDGTPGAAEFAQGEGIRPLIDAIPAVEGTGRFVERVGTGASESAQKAPRLSAPLEAVEASIAKAREEAGKPMDPALRDVNLPGLKRDQPTLKPWVIHTRNGVNEVVNLSSAFINRIATPFRNPVVVDNTEAVYKEVGSDIYYTPDGQAPVGIFIVDGDNPAQVVSLTIMPVADIPGQNVIIKMEDLRATKDLAPNANRVRIDTRGMDYVSQIRALMAQAVRGSVDGFSIVPLDGGTAKIGTIQVAPDIVFSGATLDLYRYSLKNTGSEPVDLVETAFYRQGVRAVSFFPYASLDADAETYVFLLADKSDAAGGH